MTQVIAFDLASVTGICFGLVGGPPACWTVRWASQGATKSAIFGNALKYLSGLHSIPIDVVAIEDTLPTTFTRGRTNKRTNDILVGLASHVHSVFYNQGIYQINEHRVSDIRLHFIGQNCPRKEAKQHTIRKCRELGWDVKNDNEADAAALWHYQCSLLDPRQALKVSPLFRKGVSI